MKDLSAIMQEKARSVMAHAYSVYSHFSVGACLVTVDGQFFVGCNVECSSYRLTQCAEGNAIGAMVASGRNKILEIVIVSSGKGFCMPCGACRQLIAEFAGAEMLVHLADEQGRIKTHTLADLFPYPFNLSEDACAEK